MSEGGPLAPRFSIVIASDGRASALAETLESLRYLRGPAFEVCVVRGPTEDGIARVLAAWAGRLKVAKNDERNIARSRNLGIALAAGDVVAFLDDDAIPEPEWLGDLAPPYADRAVGAAGGFVYGPNGRDFQYRFATVDRMGEANLDWRRPAPELCFPLTANFPHLLGANCSFRRASLLDVGGFDEEFDYYLDESDACCRVVDAGWEIRQLDRAFVHHRTLPSPLRNGHRIVHDWYPFFKNKLYFAFLNGGRHADFGAIMADAEAFLARWKANVEWAIREGWLAPSERARFAAEIGLAWREGIARGLRGTRRLPSLGAPGAAFLPFPRLSPAGGARTFVFLASGVPAAAVPEGASRAAALGHQVHVLLAGAGEAKAGFAGGLWRHEVRVAPGASLSAAMEAEVAEIAKKRAIEAIEPPRDRRCVLVLGVHRSGTSASAGALALAGVDLGSHLTPGRPENPRGFFEDDRVWRLHERLLAGLGVASDSPRSLPAGWTDGPAARAGVEALVETLASFRYAGLWGVKDPRLCRAFPIWPEVLRRLGAAPRIVLVLRHPFEVAASLAMRDRMNPERALALWFRYTLEAERTTRDYPRAVLVYPDLLAEGAAALAPISEALGLGLAQRLRAAAPVITAFLDPDLRRAHAEPDLSPVPGALGERANALFHALRRLPASEEIEAIAADLNERGEFPAPSDFL